MRNSRRAVGSEWRMAPPPDLRDDEVQSDDPASIRPTGRLARQRERLIDPEVLRFTAFIAVHIPLALVIAARPALATVHAYLTLAIGAWWATSRLRVDRVVYVAAYIVGAEVLWRMTGADIIWEFGKYATAAIMLLSLFVRVRLSIPVLLVVYFASHMPSIPLTFEGEPLDIARQQISFNLSGPLALFVSGWFFSHARLSKKQLRFLYIALAAPIVGVATLATRSTFFAGEVVFTNSSNLMTSGGFGPNQVSAILGLGTMMSAFVMLDGETRWSLRVVMMVAMIGLAAQSALTFSRAGLYMAAGGVGMAALVAMRDRRLRARLVPLVVVVAVAGNFVLLPFLNAFTSGALSERFTDTYRTGRDQAIEADLYIWQTHPTFGVGPGEGRAERARYMAEHAPPTARIPRNMAAHTEFSRLLAEHGLFGLGALVALALMGILNIRRVRDPQARALTVGQLCWTVLYMASDAMRIVAPSMIFGIGFAALAVDETAAEEKPVALPKHGGVLRPLTAGHPALLQLSTTTAGGSRQRTRSV